MPLNVLVADDSLATRMLIRKSVLELEPDADVVLAATGEQAITAAEESLPDIAILDFNMPNGDGLEAAKGIQALSPDVKICIITADGQTSLKQTCENVGISYIRKPLNADYREAIKDWLSDS